jgi:hypothetical protein
MQQQVWHSKIAHSAHTAFISEQTAASAVYNINWLVFVTELKSVSRVVWTGSLNKAVYASSLKG